MIRTKYNEKPENWEDAYDSFRVDSSVPQSDRIWVSLQENLNVKRISEMKDEEFKGKIREKMIQWSKEARSHADDESWWPECNASVVFWCDEGQFVILPEDLGKDVDDYMFFHVQYDIQFSLYTLGTVYWTEYTGRLD